jgi:thymidylate synthase ThyX
LKVKVLEECGYNHALLGTSLSRNQPPEKMELVCKSLAPKNGGHNKFLEFISVWIDITAPRYWWQQMATYRIGNSWLSESTMYTITKKPLSQEDFEKRIDPEILKRLVLMHYENADRDEIKNNLPEGFLQRRIMITNYKALKNIIDQRHDHKLSEWRYFCNEILDQIEHPEFIVPPFEEK